MDSTYGSASISSNSQSPTNMSLQDVNMRQRRLAFSECLKATGYTNGSSDSSPSGNTIASCANYQPHPHPYPHPQRIYNQQQHQSLQSQSQVQQIQQQAAENIALDYLRCTIQRLELNPRKFKVISKHFITIFHGYENNVLVIRSAMEEIFKESLLKGHFRSSGVKLYNLLYVLNPRPDSLFQTLLKYKLDYHRQEVDLYMKACLQQMVRETAFLLTELFKQLRTEGSRIHLIAEHIVYVLRQLLTQRRGLTARDVRCIYRTLKLVGDDLTADCAIEMRHIIAQLDVIKNNAPGKYLFLNEVIGLHRNHWSRKDSASSSLERELNNPAVCDFMRKGPADTDLDPEIEKRSEKEADLNTLKNKIKETEQKNTEQKETDQKEKKTEAEADTDTDTEAKMEAEVEMETKTGTEMETKVENDIEMRKTKTEADTMSESEAKVKKYTDMKKTDADNETENMAQNEAAIEMGEMERMLELFLSGSVDFKLSDEHVMRRKKAQIKREKIERMKKERREKREEERKKKIQEYYDTHLLCRVVTLTYDLTIGILFRFL